ncbi:MAG: cation-translocating P-type ATPase, partial [Ruminococcus sp.]|nr:cation-translocating P-type ATPase [Ruminococcus sp.]
CGLVFLLNMLRVDVINFDSIMESLMFAIALAVAAIPEALSSIVTIVLSFGTQKMSRENAIIRKLQAVEGLGSVSVICSDKTGTLTQNKMTVRKIVTDGKIIAAKDVKPENNAQHELLLASVLCSDAICKDETEIGDPTETALVRFVQNRGLSDEKIRQTYLRISEIPFDSERKLMSTLHSYGNTKRMYTKGATDVMLERMKCSETEKKRIRQQLEELSKQGLRVLCFAFKECQADTITLGDENELTYLGLIAEMDPPREESKQAVAECRSAGIKPVMITGDHIVTASAIAKEIGILERPEEAIEGVALDAYTDKELVDYVADKSVYARVTPEHKIRIVKAWQKRDKVVAMTGDGVNDAPALKQADVGVAMGITGTEVSKDAAAMVLADDNFATIVKAVKNGRNIYENIKKAILFLLSGNLAGIIVVLFNSAVGLPVPFAAIHLLFINLLTDSLPAIALGLEPHSDSVMKKKPRPAGESIMTRDFLIGVGYSGFVISIAVIGAFLMGYYYGGTHDSSAAMTMAFATLCMSRLFHGFSCKSEKPVIFTKQLWNNAFAIWAFLAGMVLINTVLWIPGLHSLFQITDNLSIVLVLAMYGFSIGSMLVIQLIKGIAAAVKHKK